ncbi:MULTISPECIES: N-acetylmuramoyl-L-alanine amidase [Cytobacillus]|uniref:N-acetylmuramoyl-L-alanine amidase n=1 Tax=Cytobacillus TaxID=2675230 RepID=UPI00204190BC|nr:MULTISPECIES: N-acetylmuramoyl-L-alanine amidase [Cytobacillus]MCM3391486.1 N-acetylmuramoyl-L-alanine amidase [Cytobacillus oceanisediminis]UQX53803.1 N-acetylmuramoyl-L-alanine amidase [Cytobacillus pseudoceanisediminis]
MKSSLVKVFCVLVLLFHFVPQFTQSVHAAYSFEGKATATILNVRAKATVSSTVIGKLKKGQVVTISAQQKGWSKITTGKTTGWVSSAYLSPVTWTGYVTATSLNVRKLPNANGSIVTKVPINTAVTVEGKDGSWLKVYIPSQKSGGWVSASYVSKKKPAVPPKTLGAFYVTADILNVRASAAASSKVVGKVSKGAAVEVHSQKGNWSSITAAKGLKGWVSSSYIDKKRPVDEEEAVTIKETRIILKENSNIRKGPGTNFGVIALEKAGTSLVKTGESKGWIKVKTSKGKEGWIAGWLVTSPNSGLKGKVIAIDAGHGGFDNGTSGKIHKEKTLNLKTAQELKTLLQKSGAKVVMTRSNDQQYLSLNQRVNISHVQKADAFISIHYNAYSSTSSGIMTFYYNNSKDGRLAQSIHNGLLVQTGMRNLGVKYGNYHVLRTNKQPSVLLELGFLSNPNEEKHVATADYQRKAAMGIYDGLNQYFLK